MEKSDHPEVEVIVHVCQQSYNIYIVSLQVLRIREIIDPNFALVKILSVLSRNLIYSPVTL